MNGFQVNQISSPELPISKATTTYAYTTVAPSGSIISHAIGVNLCAPNRVGIKASAPIGLPSIQLSGGAFKQFKVIALPTSGTLYVGTVAVTANSFWSKQDFAGMYYVLTNEASVTDSFTFRVESTVAVSPAYTTTLTVTDCSDCVDCGCVTTTTP